MTLDIDKEKLVAYVLGELDETERDAVEKALEEDEALRATVAELRATANLAAKALEAEPAHELTDSQWATITSRAEKASTAGPIGRVLRERWRAGRPFGLVWKLAAVVLLVGLAWGVLTPSFVGRSRRSREIAMIADGRGEFDSPPAQQMQRLGRVAQRSRVDDFYFERKGVANQPWYADSIHGLDEKGEAAVVPGSLALVEPSQPGRYLIKNASILIETEDARKASDTLVEALEKLGGYVSDLRESVDRLGRRSIHVQIRVPADKFDATMQQLEPLGKVLNREITTQDVTEEFVDTDARVRNLKATEERLLKHFERTGDLEGIVQIERELNRIREQIERLEGRLRYLSNRVDFSTFNISLQEKPKKEPMVPPETFSVAKVASEATRRLVHFFQSLTARIIWLGVWAVVWVPLLAVAIFLIRRAMRQTSKSEE